MPDLRLTEAAPTEVERAAIDAALTDLRTAGIVAPTWGRDIVAESPEAQARRSLLLPALHAAQARVGWVSPGAVNYISQRLGAPPAEIYGVASFYALFALQARPPLAVHLCDDLACLTAGSDSVAADLERQFGPPGEAGPASPATWLRSPCLGLCDRGPAALVTQAGETPTERLLGSVNSDAMLALLGGAAPEPQSPASPPVTSGTEPRLSARVGRIDPTSLDAYRAAGGYSGLRAALALGPDGVIREVLDSKLMGRGGAAFPTGRKWEAVAHAAVHPHYLVCNADESEPGTFKDRVMMEADPFALVEAMTIAGYAIGAEQGYLYIRAEYPLAAERLSAAIDQARTRGLLGANILGHSVHFDIELRRGAGAYICGEETALFNSIEGFRGEPRNKPPFPTQVGLFGKPTAINNVETLLNVLEVVRLGGPAYAQTGTPDSTGTKLFCLSGCVSRPGLYEVAFGTTLGELLDLAGGVRDGRPLRAVLLGGAAGSFVRADRLDTPLTFAGTRAIGASLGSGVVMVFDDQVDLRSIVRRIAAFFRDESCGQCVPCRVGTVRQEEALTRLIADRPLGSRQDELTLIAEIGQVMRDASICGLGQAAASAVESAIKGLDLFQQGADT